MQLLAVLLLVGLRRDFDGDQLVREGVAGAAALLLLAYDELVTMS